jgi:hypothetical protein
MRIRSLKLPEVKEVGDGFAQEQMKSHVIFSHRGYVVCLTRAGLSVQFRDKGKVMPRTHPQFDDWMVAFQEALDKTESLALCRYFLA